MTELIQMQIKEALKTVKRDNTVVKHFPNVLGLLYTPELKEEFILLWDFIYCDENIRLTCPEGMRTDLASIPRLMRWLFKGHNKNTYAAVPHDFLYRCGGVFLMDGKEVRLTRKQCDKLFYRALLHAGVPKWKAKAMYMGVRIGGRSSFKKVT